MVTTNYHLHSHYCDGSGNLEDFIEFAIRNSFTAIGLTGHSPLPFPNDWTMKNEDFPAYVDEAKKLKKKYSKHIQIYIGVETDYLDSIHNPNNSKYRELGIEYQIGSIHMLKDKSEGKCYAIEGPLSELNHLINNTFNGHIEEVVKFYYKMLNEMLETGGFKIVGHFDIIKKHNKRLNFFDENSTWYKESVFKSLELIKQKEYIMEINTGGISSGYTNDYYPSNWIINEAAKLGIPIIINSDAHKPEHSDFHLNYAENTVKRLGYNYRYELLNNAFFKKKIE